MSVIKVLNEIFSRFGIHAVIITDSMSSGRDAMLDFLKMITTLQE